ncbi:hypothetical protein HPP92_023874 [Vanilla planifolia]|uniref:Uncharacterized protein n=1 Tax=Vanilla planifolia TaxID=51239 RepID=A0A835PJ89_VANPL|nr:hypothetical protein HPP92_024203 [Vanilla planifolia]KAG0456086.1 hypothetical protein HPP92_023874 [Vanilla planifolia]
MTREDWEEDGAAAGGWRRKWAMIGQHWQAEMEQIRLACCLNSIMLLIHSRNNNNLPLGGRHGDSNVGVMGGGGGAATQHYVCADDAGAIMCTDAGENKSE